MFEFTKLCNEFEKLSPVERGAMLAAKTVKVLAKLHAYETDEFDPVVALAAFIVGSVAADGVIDEKEYLLIYPSLVAAFGEDFDYESVKGIFKENKFVKKAVHDYTEDLMKVLADDDDEMREDLVCLCLCVMSVDGKITLKEKNYIKRLIKA